MSDQSTKDSARNCSRRFGRLFLTLSFTAAWLTTSSSSSAQTRVPTLQEQASRSEQQLSAARAANRRAEEASALITLCNVYRQMGKSDQALADGNEALSIEQTIGSRG